MLKNRISKKNIIEKKQIFLINSAKQYLRNLNKKGIDVSKSSFSYLNTSSKSPGFSKILSWLELDNLRFKCIYFVFFNILSIIKNFNYYLVNFENQKFEKIILTWGKKNDFKNKFFFDKFANIKSNSVKNSIFFVIYLDYEIPKKIPRNVILLCKKNKTSLWLFLKYLSSHFFKNLFSIKKFFHYFSSQTIFAEEVNRKILTIIKKNKIKKIIMPYEGQPFQTLVFKTLKKNFKNIKTFGFVHSMVPALPLNFIKKKGSPDYIYLTGNSQKKVFVNYLGWNLKQIKIVKSFRIKKTKNSLSTNSIFFGMNIYSLKDFSILFDRYIESKKSLPVLKVKKHPQMLFSKEQVKLENMINNILLNNKKKINKYKKKKYSFHIGSTSAFIQFLEMNFDIIHFSLLPELEVYTQKIWKEIIHFELYENTYTYKLAKKNNLIILSKNKYNINMTNLL